MKHPTLILLLIVLLSLEIGYFAGYRARVSEETVIYHPNRFLPPVPSDLSVTW